MKLSFSYRLEPLLTLKQKARERAEIALARALFRLAEERKKLKKFEEERQRILERQKEIRRQLHGKMVSGRALVKDGTGRVNFLKKLAEDEKAKEVQIVNQKKTIMECETQVKRARRDYIDAVKELRVMEKHKALWRKKLDLELSRREEREMDELGNVIHQLGTKLNQAHRAVEGEARSGFAGRGGDASPY